VAARVYASAERLAKFYEIASGDALAFLGKLIGGGDDERELGGQMPATWLTDPPLPLFEHKQVY